MSCYSLLFVCLGFCLLSSFDSLSEISFSVSHLPDVLSDCSMRRHIVCLASVSKPFYVLLFSSTSIS